MQAKSRLVLFVSDWLKKNDASPDWFHKFSQLIKEFSESYTTANKQILYRESLKTTLMLGVKYDKTSQPKCEAFDLTLNQKTLNQILWLSPSLFLFSSSFSSSFLSFPATDKYVNSECVTRQSTNFYDHF